MADYLSISSLTKYLKLKFDRNPYLERVYVTGQVSNFRKRPNHQYFSLKDEGAVIQATMWGGVYKKLGFDLEEGLKVNAIGKVQLYEPGGSYSLIIEQIEPDGVGALALQFEQLKKALAAEGLFKPEFKQPLPRFTKKIGVVTSPSGAVIQDIITTVSRRFPGVEIVLYPTKVQGEGAAKEVADNIRRANERADLDVLIVGRGGGSMEDLWAFNEEIVVRAIFESRIPVISSVGHETDTTLADFVADSRAATPTAAAELATPVTKSDLVGFLQQSTMRLSNSLSRTITHKTNQVNRVRQSVIFRQPERLYDGYLERVDRLTMQLEQSVRNRIDWQGQTSQVLHHRLQATDLMGRLLRYRERLIHQERLLRSNMANCYDSKLLRAQKAMEALLTLDTQRIIARGYALVRDEGKVIDSVQQVAVGSRATVQLKDGSLEVEVKDVNKEPNI